MIVAPRLKKPVRYVQTIGTNIILDHLTSSLGNSFLRIKSQASAICFPSFHGQTNPNEANFCDLLWNSDWVILTGETAKAFYKKQYVFGEAAPWPVASDILWSTTTGWPRYFPTCQVIAMQQLWLFFLVGAWPTPLKNMKVNRDYYLFPIIIWKNINNVPNHQPVYMCFAFLKKFLPGKCRKVFFFSSSPPNGRVSRFRSHLVLGEGKNMSNHQPLPTTVDPPTMLQLCKQNKIPYEADRICILGAFWKAFGPSAP